VSISASSCAVVSSIPYSVLSSATAEVIEINHHAQRRRTWAVFRKIIPAFLSRTATFS